jgi:hypothetical protein
MAKRLAILFLVLAPDAYAQEVPVEEGALLNIGKTATLGVEASTAFAFDAVNSTTGLETKAGMELLLPLFPNADRGLYPTDFSKPTVRLALKNASFSWLNIFQTRGGNYEQDDFNSWAARPLVLTFDSFAADLVWSNYFFRVASSTTIMQTDTISLFSIFEEVMDTRERWYVFWPQTRALWTADRYNIQQLPLLKGKLARNYVDEDYRNFRTRMSGILAAGAEFEKFSVTLKAASRYPGVPTTDPVQPANTDNAWLVGADFTLVPIENLTFDLTGFAGINYEKTDVNKNPVNFGASVEYLMPLSDRYFLTPKAGFDFAMDTAAEETEWEAGAGVLFHTRGYNYLTSSRVLDRAEVIPIGASLSMNVNQDTVMNVLLSWFEPAGPDSMLPNFGGFLQFELADLLENDKGLDYAVLAQIEYLIAGKFLPYVRGGYVPVFKGTSTTETTGDYSIRGALGCFMTIINFFSIDVRYEIGLAAGELDRNLFSTVFTIRM